MKFIKIGVSTASFLATNQKAEKVSFLFFGWFFVTDFFLVKTVCVTDNECDCVVCDVCYIAML